MSTYRAVCAARPGNGVWRVEHSPDGVVFEVLVDGYDTEAEALRHILVVARIERDKARRAAAPANESGMLDGSCVAMRRPVTVNPIDQILLRLRR